MKIANVTPLISKGTQVLQKCRKPHAEINEGKIATTNLNNLPHYPLLNFEGYRKRHVENGNLNGYERFGQEFPGATPPAIEQEKFRLSMRAEEQISDENYLEAIKTKITIADICRQQGNQRDTFLLEQTTRQLYAALPKYQKEEAKGIIAEYNEDMAKYIDEDIKNL
ncbi:hypothetical protein IJ425_05840 [bacterium]|nr:hypothetical protein [bacterium]